MKLTSIALLLSSSIRPSSCLPSLNDISSSAMSNVLERLLIKKRIGDVKFYKYLDWIDIHEIMLELAEDYPKLATLQNAQDEYGIAVAGGEGDCPLDDDFNRRLLNLDEEYVTMGKREESHRRKLQDAEPGCKNWFLTIEDSVAHYDGSDSKRDLPTLFLSGTVHGNERVGPTAVIETATLLLDAAYCEGLPHDEYPGENTPLIVKREWREQVKEAHDCRRELIERGITDYERRWLARLVTTRRIILVPAANALGFYREEREEDGLDPNSDFPFDLHEEESKKCMETIAGRAINEIFRNNIVQLAVTFHAGTDVVAYNWGSPSFAGFACPDEQSQMQMAGSMSRFAGALEFWDHGPYEVGTMNEMVYPVRGGMEDWAYAGSWAKDQVDTCNPDTYKGYDQSKTVYNDATLRAFNVLVETSEEKAPPAKEAGSDYDLFNPEWQKMGSGHITRNIRLLTAMIDLVQPYVSVISINSDFLSDDIVPSRRRDERACMKHKAVQAGERRKGISVQWIVGGGITIEKTGLIYGKWDAIPEDIDGDNQPEGDALNTLLDTIEGSEDASERLHLGDIHNGRTRWHKDGQDPKLAHKNAYTGLLQQPMFGSDLDVSMYDEGEEIVVFPFAMLDESWGWPTDPGSPSEKSNATVTVPEQLPPQSHLANARTNPDWHHSDAGQRVKGRKYWFGTPVTIIKGEKKQDTVEMSWRLPEEEEIVKVEEKIAEEIEEYPVRISFVAILIVVATAGFLVYRNEVRKKRSKMFREISTEIDGMEMRDVDNGGDDGSSNNNIHNHTID